MKYYPANIIYTIKIKFSELPFGLISLVSIVCITGFSILYSAAGGSFYPWAYKQILYYIMFMPLAILLALIDIKYIYKYSYFLYFLTCVMLFTVEAFGHSAMGAKRWIGIGINSIKIQPSELIKISVILMLARYFHNLNLYELRKLHHIIISIIITLIPISLIMKQPDLGTGIVTLLIVAFIFFTAGVELWKFGVIFIAGIISLPLIWSFLREYQKKE